MFNVYLTGSNTKWDWSNGPIPASQLGNIDRIEVSVVSASSKPDSKGGFATHAAHDPGQLDAERAELRRHPAYNVDGYVFEDNVVKNGVRDTGEPGVSGASVRLGVLSTADRQQRLLPAQAHARARYTLRQRAAALDMETPAIPTASR